MRDQPPTPPQRCDTQQRQRVIRAARELGVPRDYAAQRKLRVVREPRDLACIGPDIHDRPQWMESRAARAWLRMRDAARSDGVELQVALVLAPKVRQGWSIPGLTTNGSRLISIAQKPFVVRRRRRDRRSSAAVSNHASTRSVDHQGNADQVLLVRSPSANERMAPSFRSWFDRLTTNGFWGLTTNGSA
jgi:hypothetical protein